MKTLNAGILLVLCLFSAFTSRAEERIVKTTDGVDLFVSIKGDGIPCVYIHGGPGSGAFWLEHFSGDILENKFRMIYIDQRGVSRSGSPANGDYSIDRMVQDIEEVRKTLGIEKWLTMGHSFGGIIQMAYAEKHQERLLGMLMINCTLDFNSSVTSTIDFGIKELGITDTAWYYNKSVSGIERGGSLIGQMMEKGIFWKMHYSQKESFHRMDSVMTSVKNWNYDFSNKAFSIADYFVDYRPLAKKIKTPVLFFYGKEDNAIGKDHYLGVHFPNQLLWGADCKHVPFMENEKELESAIQAYLNKYKVSLIN